MKEIAHDRRDDLFAGTPPLEAFKLLLSWMASSNRGHKSKEHMLIMDVKRAFLHAAATREVFIELPAEAIKPGEEGMVGRLLKSMYGTRDAPQNWQLHMTKVLVEMGFKQCKTHPSIYRHIEYDIQLVVHVDDIAAIGIAADLEWVRSEIFKRFECTSKILGPDQGQELEVSFLNRQVRWTPYGIQYEHDARHIDEALRASGMEASRPVATSRVKEHETEEEPKPLGPEDAITYRRTVAILNYVAQDRPDLGFSVNECARGMSSPSTEDSTRIKRVLRYLRQVPRRVQHFTWQEMPHRVDVFSDADWAECRRTRRSTTRGVIMLGSHEIKTWSRTQASVALSSAESELNALVRASTEALCIVSLSNECGYNFEGHVLIDSSAAHGIVQRRGVGKVKHLQTQQLWVQEVASEGRLHYSKIPREQNLSDLLTHSWDSNIGEAMLTQMGFEVG